MENPGGDQPVPNPDRNSPGKYLNKACVGLIGFFLISPGASIQAFTYPFRVWADIIIGIKRSQNKLWAILSGVGKFVFKTLTTPFMWFAYAFSGLRNLISLVKATGEKGEKAKVPVVCKFWAYTFGQDGDAVAKNEKVSLWLFVRVMLFGSRTIANKETNVETSEKPSKKENPEEKTDSIFSKLHEIAVVSVDENNNIKQVRPECPKLSSIGRNNESPIIF